MVNDFQISGQDAAALFTLKVHRGDGMALLAMDWKSGKPPKSFVGFAIEYKEPAGTAFFPLKNRLTFPDSKNLKDPNRLSTLRSPIQKFRWVHFPRNANLAGSFTYKVTPVFMNETDELSYGDFQTVDIALCRETYPGQLNVAFTRGFVASQAFVDRYKSVTGILPGKGVDPLTFKPSRPEAADALTWMGFEAREAILDVLDRAIADPKAQVCCVAYDLNEPEIVMRLQKLKSRVRVIIDNSKSHKKEGAAENDAELQLQKSTGEANVHRQHMGSLQHNKFIVVNSPKLQLAVCGSTNFSWRAFYVQNNNAIVVQGEKAIQPFLDAFENYWNNDKVSKFASTASVKWTSLGLNGINAKIAFSPHSAPNALLQTVADDIGSTSSNLFYSLAFLYQTPGVIKDAIIKVTKNKQRFVYGISDREVGGIVLQKPDGNLAPVFPSELSGNLPEPFKSEPVGGSGIRMHHKFVVIDFDKPTARVYLGSYNFSVPADLKNGENLLLIRDRRIAVSYLVEALSMFDHYQFRVAQRDAKRARKKLELMRPPQKAGETAWWTEYYKDGQKSRDRQLFA